MVLLEVSNAVITVSHRDTVPGVTDGYCVKTANAQKGVSVSHVILLLRTR